MTVREAYEAAVAELKSNGFDDREAHLSARLLLDDLTERSYAHLSCPDETLFAGAFPESFFDSIERVSKGEPLAHIRRLRDFYGLRFVSDHRALIPRPETELIVEHVVKAFGHLERALIADLGTGSGCIAVSIAHSLPRAMVYATDLSPDALTLARENACINEVEKRVQFVKGQGGEWAQPLLREGLSVMFDCIVTNPPYISPADIEVLPTQIKDYEPRLALNRKASRRNVEHFYQQVVFCWLKWEQDNSLKCARYLSEAAGTLVNPFSILPDMSALYVQHVFKKSAFIGVQSNSALYAHNTLPCHPSHLVSLVRLFRAIAF